MFKWYKIYKLIFLLFVIYFTQVGFKCFLGGNPPKKHGWIFWAGENTMNPVFNTQTIITDIMREQAVMKEIYFQKRSYVRN